MAYKIAGLNLREVDLTQPKATRPEGVPAGVIGTAAKGPAFVPVLFGTKDDFSKKFGTSEGGKYFGPIAVAEWMRNAKSGVYVRTLGVGNAKKSDASTGVTTYAGYEAGINMRDKDRTSGSGYSSLETVDEADVPVANPYAGAGLEDQLSINIGTLVAGTPEEPEVPATFETTSVAIGNADGNDDAITDTDFESMWLIVAEDNTTNIAFFLHTDDVQLNGLIVEAGAAHSALAQGTTIHDFTSTAQEVLLVDVSGLTLESEIASAINGVNTTALTTLSIDLSGIDVIVITAGTAGLVDPATSSSVAVPLVVTANGDGVDLIPLVPAVTGTQDFEIVIADATAAIHDGSSITTDATPITIGAAATYDIDISAVTVGDDQATALANYLVSNHSYSIVTSAATALGITTVTVQAAEGTTLTAFDASPSAPMGRVHFLGAKMYSPQSNELQDYLTDGSTDISLSSNALPVLRGVLMFPSGVMPGLHEDNATAVVESDISSVAWGQYGTNLDYGDNQGWLDNDQNFQMVLNGYTGSSSKSFRASMDPQSPIYFGKIFNTDPAEIQAKGHYLHAQYDIPAGLAVAVGAANNAYLLAGAHDHNDSAFSANSDHEPTFENWRQKFTHMNSPWIYSQELGNAPKKLFRFHALDAGELSEDKQFKVEIANIRQVSKGSYATFDVIIRKLEDTDTSKLDIESFRGVNLNPSSENYIARKIGDMHTFFDFEKEDAKQKIVVEGLYDNQSSLVRIEMNEQIESGMMDISAMPVGYAGKNHLTIGTGSLEDAGTDGSIDMKEPPLPFRQTVSDSFGSNLTANPNYCWGLQSMYVPTTTTSEFNSTTKKNTSLILNLTKHFPSVGSYHAWVGNNRGAALVNTSQVVDADVYNFNFFSLEKVWVACTKDSSGVRQVSNAIDSTMWKEATYVRNGNASGLKVDGNAMNEADGSTTKDQGYRYINPAKDMVGPSNANLKYFKFVVPMQGGFNGLDIFDLDKSAMNDISSVREMSANAVSVLGATQGPTTAAFRKSLDILSEKADVDIQLLAIPGMKSSGITDYAIDKTEDRFDALYIMDVPSYDMDDKLYQSVANTFVNITNTAKNLQDRNLDSSFAAAYFPEVNMADPYDSRIVVEAPASCAVLGAMSFNDSAAHPWYAPAGFSRGTLRTVESGTVIFDKDDLEALHVVDINPITSFAGSDNPGMVIWGQKTLLQGKSSLDRVNVRRLLIDIRRKVRKIANSILFEPNRESTLSRFSAQVNPILNRIQQQQGLDRFKVVIDATTTTQQDIENNTIRGKIFLQPTKSIEFIGLDFVVGNQID